VNATYAKHLSDAFPIHNDVKQDVFSPSVFIFTLEYAIKKVRESEEGLEFDGKISFWSIISKRKH
jgi:hypothetical protein